MLNISRVAHKFAAVVLVSLLLLLMNAPLFPQEGIKNSEKPHSQSLNQRDYQLGPGDVLSISITGILSQTIPVSNSGKIHAPYLGILEVNGLTPARLESEIARRLREQGLVKEPWVQVQVADYRARTVYILGEVQEPGQFQIRDEMYLTDLMALGLGWNEVTSPVVYLYRRNSGQPDVDGVNLENRSSANEPYRNALRIEIKPLLDGKTPELNVLLTGGEILYVPERRPEFFYIVGDVLKPGAIKMTEGKEILATQAISQAGGPSKTAKLSKGLIVRYDNAGLRQELPVDFDSILKGAKADIPIKPNDVVFIPGSNIKTVGYGILGVIPQIAATAVLF